MSKGSKEKSTQSTTVDPQLLALYNKNYDIAQNVANAPYHAYDPNMQVPGFTTQAQHAQDALTNFGNGNVGDAALNNAIGATTGLTSFNPGTIASTDLSQYMSPYQGNVIDATMQQLQRARDAGITADNQRASAAGAFGGDRQAVLNSLTNNDYLNTAASTLANLNSQNFTQAQNAASGDLNRNLSAAGLNLNAANSLAGMSNQQIQDQLAKAGALSAVGDATQQQSQNVADAQYQEFLRRIGYPVAQQQIRNSALGLIPLQQTTTTNTRQSGGGGLLGSIGSVLGGGAALISAFSDAGLKQDVKTVRFDAKGRRWVQFRYVWDEPGTVRDGVIAQEVERSDPESVTTTLCGFKMVDYAKLGGAA